MRALGAVLLLPLAAAASDPLAGRVAGPAQECIDGSASGPMIVDAGTVIYRSGATLYRSTIQGCPALRPVTTLIVERFGTGLCRNDRFRVLEPNAIIPSASCRFGAFVPYTKVK